MQLTMFRELKTFSSDYHVSWYLHSGGIICRKDTVYPAEMSTETYRENHSRGKVQYASLKVFLYINSLQFHCHYVID